MIPSGIRFYKCEFEKQESFYEKILTPKPGLAPKINGPAVYGVCPGHPFHYTIPVTGDRPMAYDVLNLPTGLTVDKATGHITGVVEKEGTFEVVLTAKNSAGSAEKKFKIIAGDQIALTPPLGWNSWNCFATAVDDQKVRAAADAMVNSGLIDHGWSYINIDDCWEIKPDTDDPLLMGEPAGRIKKDGNLEIWSRNLADGSKAALLSTTRNDCSGTMEAELHGLVE